MQKKERERALNSYKSLKSEMHRVEQGAKFSSFREISEVLRDYEIPRDGGDIPTPL